MSLARPILLRRIRNDLDELGEYLGIRPPSVADDVSFPLKFTLNLYDAEGYSSPGVKISRHSFSLQISEEYPYERPRVTWKTEIFHPNIMPPSEGGTVCVMAIDKWDFDSNLITFICSLTDLVKNPNPYDALGSETCQAAARWFLDRA